MKAALLTFSLLISEDFWVFLPFLSDRSVFVASDECAESTATAGKIKKYQKSSLIREEKVNKVNLNNGWITETLLH